LPEKDRKEKEIAARACRRTYRQAPTLKSPYFKIGFWDGLSPKVGGGLFFGGNFSCLINNCCVTLP